MICRSDVTSGRGFAMHRSERTVVMYNTRTHVVCCASTYLIYNRRTHVAQILASAFFAPAPCKSFTVREIFWNDASWPSWLSWLDLTGRPAGMLILKANGPPPFLYIGYILDDFFSRSRGECVVLWQLWGNVLEVIIKIKDWIDKYNDKYMKKDKDKDRQMLFSVELTQPLQTVAIWQRLVVAGFIFLVDPSPGAAVGGMRIEINTGYSCYMICNNSRHKMALQLITELYSH